MATPTTLRVPLQTPMWEVGPDGTQRLTRTWVIFFERLATVPLPTGEPAGIGWDVQSSTPGTDVADPVIPTMGMNIDSCQIRIKVTDATHPLTIDIRRNGTSIFATHPTIAAGTASRTVQVFRAFVGGSLAIQPKDDLVLDILSGGAWQVAIYLVPVSGSLMPAASSTSSSGLTSPLTNKGDIWTYDTTDDRLGVGSNGQVLTADSTQPTGLKWATPGSGGTVTNPGGALISDLPVFGAGGNAVKTGTKTGTTNIVAVATGTLTAGHFLTVDAAGNVIDGGSAPGGGGGGSGTVTSVALTMPAEFSVSGSPVTTSGTLAVTKANESANQVYAGPATGAAAAPTFRALVAADIPNIAESQVTNLVTDLAAKAPTARNINTTAPLTGGGNLSADLTLAVSNATNSSVGVVKPDNTTITIASGVISAVPSGGGSGAGFAWGGDGSDGAVSMDGSNTYAAFTTTTGSSPNLVYTLTRDIFVTTFSVSAGKTLITANFRIFATVSVTVSGTVQNNGSNAISSNTGGANAQTGGRVGLPQSWGTTNAASGGTAVAGTTGAGTTGAGGGAGLSPGTVVALNTPGVAGAAGGTGGASGANAGGTGGAGGAVGPNPAAANADPPREPVAALQGRQTIYTASPLPFIASPHSGGGGGGGSGAGDGTANGGNGGFGGGAGGAGGNMVIASPTITVNSGGTISCNGGTGGNGGVGSAPIGGTNNAGGGGGAGGSGGPGGILWLMYHSLNNAGTVQAAGGVGGTGAAGGSGHGTGGTGATGSNGNTGAAGAVITIAM